MKTRLKALSDWSDRQEDKPIYLAAMCILLLGSVLYWVYWLGGDAVAVWEKYWGNS